MTHNVQYQLDAVNVRFRKMHIFALLE